MKFDYDLTEDDAFQLNVGVPIGVGLIFMFINLLVFAINFLEPFSKVVLIYAYSSILVLFLLYLFTKRNKSKKKNIAISVYNFFVHNSILVLVFLILNLIFSKTIYETRIPFNHLYNYHIEKQEFAPSNSKIFIITQEEYDNYYRKGFELSIKIDESFLGYQVINERKFLRAQ